MPFLLVCGKKRLARVISGDSLSAEDYAFLAKKGYIKKQNSNFVLVIVHICDTATRKKLITFVTLLKKYI